MIFDISEWIPGNYPIPFFQTWKCKSSAVTNLSNNFDQLTCAGLSTVVFDCLQSNLIVNNVGVDCVHYLFNDDACREFLVSTFPPDVVYAYDLLIPSAFRADLWRYCILYMFGGVYMDIKYKWCVCTAGGADGGAITIRNVVDNWLMSGVRLQREGSDHNSILVLERDAPGLWPEGHFGIHNAFIISKPKNRLLFECIRQIVSYSKSKIIYPLGSLGSGCLTLPLFISGPGLLGDVWRKITISDNNASPDNYALMAPFFRLFYEGNGVIGYLYNDTYFKLLRVCDNFGYNPPDHYTFLWSYGVVWRE